MKSHTKDEKFVIAVYESAEKNTGEPTSVVDMYAVGQTIGMQARGVEATCKQLVRANFIKKISDTEIHLTPQGVRLYNSITEM